MRIWGLRIAWGLAVMIASAALLASGAYLGYQLAPASMAAPAAPQPSPSPSTVMPVRPEPPAEAVAPPLPLVPYKGPVEQIFFHPLIVYPARAFDGDGQSRGYNDWMVTVPEFKQILERLYRNNFILVRMTDLFEERQSTVVRRDLYLPEGKRPLIIDIDDLNYYDYMRANGNAFKLVLDDAGRIATYSVDLHGQPVTSYNDDIVPILDGFVAVHPDFALNGAKGVIALTGYEGILGYRTRPDTPGYDSEQREALKVVQRLKETGWSFAAHSWGHLDMAKVNYATLVADTERWKAQVEPLIGPTPVYIWPFGSRAAPSDPKFQYLQKAGFRIFAGINPKPLLQINPGYALFDRRRVDGLALAKQHFILEDLFDPDGILDPVRPDTY
ncbi:MAG: polysaccharide deacetylase family protein [Mycobacterium leprae]